MGGGKPNSLPQVYSGFPVGLPRWKPRQRLNLYIKATASLFLFPFLLFFFVNVMFKGKSLQNTYAKRFALKQTCFDWKWLICWSATCSLSSQNRVPHHNYPISMRKKRICFCAAAILSMLLLLLLFFVAVAKCRVHCPVWVLSWKEFINEGLLNTTTVSIYER